MQVDVLRHVAHSSRALRVDWQLRYISVEDAVGGEEGTGGAGDRRGHHGRRRRKPYSTNEKECGRDTTWRLPHGSSNERSHSRLRLRSTASWRMALQRCELLEACETPHIYSSLFVKTQGPP